jgi:uncharacterized integral membrane protein
LCRARWGRWPPSTWSPRAPQPDQVRFKRTRGRPRRRDGSVQLTLYPKLAGLLFAIGYSTAFVIENHREISIDFIFATARVSLIWEILLLLSVGVVGGVLLSQLYRHRGRKQRAEPANAIPDLGRRDEAVGEPGGAPPT